MTDASFRLHQSCCLLFFFLLRLAANVSLVALKSAFVFIRQAHLHVVLNCNSLLLASLLFRLKFEVSSGVVIPPPPRTGAMISFLPSLLMSNAFQRVEGFFLFKIHIWKPVVGPKVCTRAPFTQTSDSKCSLLILRKTRRTRTGRQRGCCEVAHRLQNASCIIHQWLLPFSSRPAPTYSRYQRRRLGFNLRLFPLGFACFQLNAGTETKEFTHQLRGPSEEGCGAPRCSRGGSTCTGSSCSQPRSAV